VNIGEKIKRLRLENNLTQEELADRCELSKGFISQLERDMTSPSIASLVDILESLGTNLQTFFSETEEEKIVFKKEDFFEKIDSDLGYVLEWIIPNAQKNMMEPILLTLSENGAYSMHDPHEGEEFGYVLSGTVVVNLGHKRYVARAGETFYYKANKSHEIINKGKREAKLILIGTPPNF
jgi:transcriptional regulator with XRE-family HTH domain